MEKVKNFFEVKFGNNGAYFFAPGRINLIGEHTDYNGGYVLPGAIDKGISARIRLNGSDTVKAYSIDFDDYAEFGLCEDDIPTAGWAKYIFGACREMIKRGAKIGGFDTAFSGNVPFGAGLSSSAALESVYTYALNELFACKIDKKELVLAGQKTEHNYVGVNCGIMDQFASLFGKAGHLIKLDCSTMNYEYVPFNPTGYRLVLIDSVTKHELVGSPYNRRRESCERAVKAIALSHPNVKFLADADLEMLAMVKDKISQEDFMRATYAIEENARLADTVEALKTGDYERVGRNMYSTHHGMSKLYEVSTQELDFLNDIAKECGVTGSRIMGGGFGGCTINLVKNELYDTFIECATSGFKKKYGKEPQIYPVVISEGAGRVRS